jgi:GrpB-like predicted nucleotidyltransferase (UPF0157 family)
VPGLAAKAIIDMLAVVETVAPKEAITEALLQIDWVFAPEPGDEEDRCLSYAFPNVARRSHHLHVVEERSQPWREWLEFRNRLRSRPDLVVEYGALKSDLADRFGKDPNDRDRYRNGKSGFVEWVLSFP